MSSNTPESRSSRPSRAPTGQRKPAGLVASSGAAEPAAAKSDDAAREEALEHNLVALELDEETVRRIEKLPRDMGWLLFTAGVVGMVMPGVLGTPFLVLGGLMLWPWTNRRAERWLAGHSPKAFKGSMRQINRFLDDLEKRYPRTGGKP